MPGNTHTHTLLPEGHDAQTAYRRPPSSLRSLLAVGINRDKSRSSLFLAGLFFGWGFYTDSKEVRGGSMLWTASILIISGI